MLGFISCRPTYRADKSEEITEDFLKKLNFCSIMLVLTLLVTNPAVAIEGCPNPTPDQRFQMELCAAHAGCALTMGIADACISLTSKIKAYLANKKPELDPGEYKTDRDAPLGPSELEQARKDNELYQQNRRIEERQSSEDFSQITVRDRSITTRIGQYCGTPMDQSCQNAVSEVESLKARADAFNANASFVSLRGRIVLECPGRAAPYAKIHADYWDEKNKKADEERTRNREAEEARQKKLADENAKKELADPDAGAIALPRRGGGSSALFQQAIKQTEQDESVAQAKKLATVAKVTPEESLSTPEESLSKSYDQKIATAQAQCAATNSSCEAGCLGVVAMGGLLSIFSGSRAGRSAGLRETDKQTRLCSNRCTEAKSSCDEQVSALEQEKTNSIAATSTGQKSNPNQANASGQRGAGFSCSCKAASDRQAAEFTAINRRMSNSQGVVPGLQVVLYMTSRRMALLDQLCRGQPQYSEYASMKQSYDATMRTCRQMANNSADCKPQLPWSPASGGDGLSGNSACQEGSPAKGNGRARGDMPLFSSADISSAELGLFNDAWHQKEQELHDLGEEEMPPWNHNLLKTTELRDAYFRVCDEHIAAARSRKKR